MCIHSFFGMGKTEKKKENRNSEVTRDYFRFLDKHINEVVSGDAPDFLQLNQIARELAISHTHLTDIIRKETGNHPCHFYDAGIIEKAKELLAGSEHSIAQIAMKLTYDPSNFSKFFKKWTGGTPGAFRKKHRRIGNK